MQQIDLNNKTILVTGAAGFIGSNLVKRLFKDLKDAIIKGYYGDGGYSAIMSTQNTESTVVTGYFNLEGHRLPASRRGLNIVRMSNGVVRTLSIR